ncbi:MAG: hypothetical protein ACREOF_03730 [Gemmatimonadales bacterium]
MQSDRAWWTLVVLTLAGVSVAYYVAREAERRQTEWVHALEPSGPAPTEPAIPDPRANHPAPAPPASTPAPSGRTAAEPRAVEIVEILTTPADVSVGSMTSACEQAMRDEGPWKDPVKAVPWPACIDGAGRPMVVQFCTYARLSSGEWIHTRNTGSAPRCRAELPLIKQGKVRGVASG